ncbi:MAG: twin-arginine translocase subunit TatC [Alphaproteobacteria bacterium]
MNFNINDKPRSLIEHFSELRKRLILTVFFFIASFIICYIFSEKIFKFLSFPLYNSLSNCEDTKRFIYTNIGEVFFTYLKTASFAAVLLTFPFFLYQCWKFMAPSFVNNERKFAKPLVTLVPFLFYLGILFSYTVVLPLLFPFFLSFEKKSTLELPIQFEAKVSEYFNFVLKIMFTFGISFELPIIIILMVGLNIISREQLIQKWRIVFFLICVLAAIITPPDIISMVSLILPLMLLYGISILIVKVLKI